MAAARLARRRLLVLGGPVAVGGAALGIVLGAHVGAGDLGLEMPRFGALALGLGWTAVMVAVTPIADRLATRLFAAPPDLGAFRAIQESRVKLVLGIVFAWIVGGFVEELILRGVVVRGMEMLLTPSLPSWLATMAGVSAAAFGAFAIHLYQGPRAALIVAQLSVLLGVLFVLAGESLWPVIVSHGFYDTVAFIRFARRSSKYSKLRAQPFAHDVEQAPANPLAEIDPGKH